MGEEPRVVLGPVGELARFLSENGIKLESKRDELAFSVVERAGRLDLRPPGEADKAGIQAVFPPDRYEASAMRNPLVRAFGRKTDPIFDLTAGLGGDAYRLARAGHRVFASERHPVVYALLATGWARDREAGRVDHEIAERLEFAHEEGACVASGDVETLGVEVEVDQLWWF